MYVQGLESKHTHPWVGGQSSATEQQPQPHLFIVLEIMGRINSNLATFSQFKTIMKIDQERSQNNGIEESMKMFVFHE